MAKSQTFTWNLGQNTKLIIILLHFYNYLNKLVDTTN